MNIVFVTYHTCARANKMAQALTDVGHQVIVLQHLAASEEILYDQTLSGFYRDRHDLALKVEYFNDWADIFHVHNEPDWPVHVTKSLADHPVIYDCHDLDSQRKGQANEDEIKAFEVADGFVFPSASYRDGAMEYHNVKDKFAAHLLYSKCTQSDVDSLDNFLAPPKVHGIVYEGNHIASMEDTDFQPGHPNYYNYRYYREFVENCSVRNIPVALYATRPAFDGIFRRLGALTNPMLPFRTMLRELTRYQWGFCGHPDSCAQWQKAMPNKLFEYLVAGLPVIAWNCAEVEDYIAKHGVGIVVNGYDEISLALNNLPLCRDLKQTIRGWNEEGHFVMNNDIKELELFYMNRLGVYHDQCAK